MNDRRRTFYAALVVVLYVATVSAAPFFAVRSEKLYWFVALTLAAGLLLVTISRRVRLSWKVVITVAIVLRAAAFWLPPGLSDDAYRYVWDGIIQVEGQNPYQHLPTDPTFDHHRETRPFESLNSADFYSVYPPLSQITFLVAAKVTNSSWPATYYAIKLIVILAELLAIFGLTRLTTASRAVLYAWNPVVVIEIAGQGHTEGLTAGLIVAGVLLSRRRQGIGAAAALAGAGMVKLYPLSFLPPLWRRHGVISVIASVAAVVLLSLPYFGSGVVGNIRSSLDLYVSFFEFNAGPYFAVKEVLRGLTGEDWSKTIGPVFRWLFVAVVAAIYWVDRKRRWSIEKVIIALIAAFLLLSTTIHPWYLVPLMAVLVLEERLRWHWYWLTIVSVGTYLLYVDGPYWEFVILGWSGWAALAAVFHFDHVLQFLQRRRGRAKWRRIREWIASASSDVGVLDLGCAEGYVGLAAAEEVRGRVQLADILPMNRTDLPWTKVEEGLLPFESNEFDYVILYFVLHHCSSPEDVIREACRVSRDGVVVVESTFKSRAQLRVLTIVDRVANRVRSKGRMAAQEPGLEFKRASEWTQLFRGMGLSVKSQKHRGHLIHRQTFYLLSK